MDLSTKGGAHMHDLINGVIFVCLVLSAFGLVAAVKL
jgi:hypothetical protein